MEVEISKLDQLKTVSFDFNTQTLFSKVKKEIQTQYKSNLLKNKQIEFKEFLKINSESIDRETIFSMLQSHHKND